MFRVTGQATAEGDLMIWSEGGVSTLHRATARAQKVIDDPAHGYVSTRENEMTIRSQIIASLPSTFSIGSFNISGVTFSDKTQRLKSLG